MHRICPCHIHVVEWRSLGLLQVPPPGRGIAIRPGSHPSLLIRPHLTPKRVKVDFKSWLKTKTTWPHLATKRLTFDFKSTSEISLPYKKLAKFIDNVNLSHSVKCTILGQSQFGPTELPGHHPETTQPSEGGRHRISYTCTSAMKNTATHNTVKLSENAQCHVVYKFNTYNMTCQNVVILQESR